MLSLFVARLETPSRRLVLSVSFIAVGTALASAGEVNLNLTGMFIMLLSELFESIRLVMTQLLLTGLRFHPSEARAGRAAGTRMKTAGLGVAPARVLHMYRACAAPTCLGQRLSQPRSTDDPSLPCSPAPLAVEGLMYLAPACTFWLLIGSTVLELRPMLASGAFGLMLERPVKFLAAAMMGFAVNSLAYIVIQVGGDRAGV